MIKVSSLFGQILSEVFSSADFEKLVLKHEAELLAKGFGCNTQLMSTLFCDLSRADSLRKIFNDLSCCNRKLVPRGIAPPTLIAMLTIRFLRQFISLFPPSYRTCRSGSFPTSVSP